MTTGFKDNGLGFILLLILTLILTDSKVAVFSFTHSPTTTKAKVGLEMNAVSYTTE